MTLPAAGEERRPRLPLPWRRRRGDPQPESRVAVLLASTGGAFPAASIAAARDRTAGGPVAVLIVAQVHGSSFGLPNPGLLPTTRERRQAQERVSAAISALQKARLEVDGQVAVTRYGGRSIARIAALRGAGHVVLVTEHKPGWRRLLEGDAAATVRRRFGENLTVITAPAGADGR